MARTLLNQRAQQHLSWGLDGHSARVDTFVESGVADLHLAESAGFPRGMLQGCVTSQSERSGTHKKRKNTIRTWPLIPPKKPDGCLSNEFKLAGRGTGPHHGWRVRGYRLKRSGRSFNSLVAFQKGPHRKKTRKRA